MEAVEVTEYGDSGVLDTVEREPPEPGDCEVRVDVEAVGINFADIMQRRGAYPGGPEPPYSPGMEIAGTVDSAEGIEAYDEGDSVVAMVDRGGYAEYAVADARTLLPFPDGLSAEEAAGYPVQFLTAHSCLFGWGGLDRDAGETVLVQAAAGGVGTAAVQMASNAGAEVFGTASKPGKLEHTAAHGCDHPINYEETDFRDVVDEETEGGVDLVLESVGGDVFDSSLDALAQFGTLVTYGVASGETASASNQRLLFENKSVVGFHLGQASRHDPSRVMKAVPEVVDGLETDDLEVVVGETFDLDDAAEAHAFIEDRDSIGKVVLTT